MKTPFQPVSPSVSLPDLERETLAFWKSEKIFERSLRENDPTRKVFHFYDGPPFATGLPHYGHLLAGTLKDIVPRYWTMRGYSVPRRFGWDTHGVPVEFEINKTLGLHSRKAILEYGVEKYNAACRGIVDRYAEEWKHTVERMGRWVDMDNAYFTLQPEFMSSVWWVFQSLYNKGLIYQGEKVVPFSTGISTSLSNFEANLNYQQVQDPAITIELPDLDRPGEVFLAWTTTPWTLPSNLALAVGDTLPYVRVKVAGAESDKTYWIGEALSTTVVQSAFGKDATFEVVERATGKDLVGRTYKPLFTYFENLKSQGAFRIIASDHVTTDAGTGIVHMAPAFGEDDYAACKREKIPLVCPIDDDGKFTAEVPDYQGINVKDADKEIIKKLKQDGRLFKQDTLMHSYPYCYRSNTPLIYKAVKAWFVSVEKIKDRLVKNNQDTRWVPAHLRDGRFGNWLENARDWAISRSRFWGTPIPIWQNAEGERLCVGSREELEKLTGRKIPDLHMDQIDGFEIPSPTGKSPLKRVPDVLDCWFESGSMPYAQWGYPFKNKKEFEEGFPADFIAEGLDQTRGWFYTLMVIGTALFDKAPFKNVVVNGMVLAEDGKKMSKSLRNYPDPNTVLDTHGADAVRLYMIDSPVVKAEDLRFSEKGVRDIVRRILLRYWNAYSFFVSYANVDEFVPSEQARGTKPVESPNLLDQWIQSRLQGLIINTHREMEAYQLSNVVPVLLQFVEDLTNTYIRFNRTHFWQEGMPKEKVAAYETLYQVLVELSKLLAPFAPFVSEVVYRNLSAPNGTKCAQDSVHLESLSAGDRAAINLQLESAVQVLDQLVTLGRNLREKLAIKGKIPLRTITVIHRDAALLEEVRKLEPYFKEELNVRAVSYRSDEDSLVQISAKARFQILGKRLGARMKTVAAGVEKITVSDIRNLEAGNALTIEGEAIRLEDVEIRRASHPDHPHLLASQLVSVELDPTVTPEQEQEGLAREVIRKVQEARKNAKLNLDDRIELWVACDGLLLSAVQTHRAWMERETLALRTHVTKESADHEPDVFHEASELEEGLVSIGIRRIRG